MTQDRDLRGRSVFRTLLLGTVAVQVAFSLTACLPEGPSRPNGAAAPAESSEPARAPADVPVPVPVVAAAAPAAAEVGPSPAGSPPVLALQLARARLLDGNYRQAMDEFDRLQREFAGTAEAAEASFRYGEAAFADGKLLVAQDALRRFLAAHPEHPRRPVALLMLGLALEGEGSAAVAAAVYRQYVEASRTGDAAASVADVVHLHAAAIAFGESRVADGGGA